MPKEVVHWMVAARSAELLASGPFGPALARCPRGLRLGANFHDTLFYLRGEHPAGMRNLPHRLHGSHGEDTFELLRLQAAHLHARKDQPLPTAFFVGLASHIFADAAIHPLVFFLTGNYYDTDARRRTEAVRRHRALESLLDMVAAGSLEAVLDQSLRGLVNGLEGPLSLACPPEGLAGLAGCDAQAAAKAVEASLDTFCTVQALCRMSTLARAAHELSPILPDSLRELLALLYAPQLYEQQGAVAGRLSYQNPATGEALSATLAELMEQAARRTAAFCTAQAASIAARGLLAETGVGPSLDMGLPEMPVSQARFFANRLLPAD